MFQPIWPSSDVKIFLLRKLLSSVVNIYAGPFDALVLELVHGVLPCCVVPECEKCNRMIQYSITIWISVKFSIGMSILKVVKQV
jgi:hypothetical protein